MRQPAAKQRPCWSSTSTPKLAWLVETHPNAVCGCVMPQAVQNLSLVKMAKRGLDWSILQALYSQNGTVLPLKGRRKEEIFKGRR